MARDAGRAPRAGWRNYSLRLDRDGLLIGYFESERTLAGAQAAMAGSEANERWQEYMAPLFAGTSAGDALVVLDEVFHLE